MCYVAIVCFGLCPCQHNGTYTRNVYPAIPTKKLALILRFAEGKKEPLSRKILGKAARNALGKGTGPLNLPGTAVGIFLSGLQKWAQKSPEVVETSGLFCVGIYFGAPSWRSGRDSNPRAAQHGHTISSRARYDRFDTTPDICRHN